MWVDHLALAGVPESAVWKRRLHDRSIAELTLAVFGESLTMEQLLRKVGETHVAGPTLIPSPLWIASVGYERHKDSRAFARSVRDAGVERLIDVRELPISRRRGYAKTALAQTMASEGVEYVHVRALGNPKRFRDLYKSGRVAEGRAAYERFLLNERRDDLKQLIELLSEKPSALMCVEHDAATCHRTVIVEALRDELGVSLEVVQIA